MRTAPASTYTKGRISCYCETGKFSSLVVVGPMQHTHILAYNKTPEHSIFFLYFYIYLYANWPVIYANIFICVEFSSAGRANFIQNVRSFHFLNQKYYEPIVACTRLVYIAKCYGFVINTQPFSNDVCIWEHEIKLVNILGVNK